MITWFSRPFFFYLILVLILVYYLYDMVYGAATGVAGLIGKSGCRYIEP